MNKIYFFLITLSSFFLLSSCQANQPFYPSYLIGLSNPCNKTVTFNVFFNTKHQYSQEMKAQDPMARINIGMKEKLLRKLGTEFTATISSPEKSHSYTKEEVKKYFFLAHDEEVQVTHWQVDAGELCGKDLMKTKKHHLKIFNEE